MFPELELRVQLYINIVTQAVLGVLWKICTLMTLWETGYDTWQLLLEPTVKQIKLSSSNYHVKRKYHVISYRLQLYLILIMPEKPVEKSRL